MENAKKKCRISAIEPKEGMSLTYYGAFKASQLLRNDWFPKQFTAYTDQAKNDGLICLKAQKSDPWKTKYQKQ